jgi:hypothetical protein
MTPNLERIMHDNGGFTSSTDTSAHTGHPSWPTSPTPDMSPGSAGMPTGDFYRTQPAATTFGAIVKQLKGPIIGMIVVLVLVLVPIAITLIAYFSR